MALAAVRVTVIEILSSTKPRKSIFCWDWSTDFTGWIVKPRLVNEVFYLSHSLFSLLQLKGRSHLSSCLCQHYFQDWKWIPSSRDLCQVCKAEVDAVVGFSSSSSFRSRTSVQSCKEYLQTFIIKAKIWLQKPDFPAAQLGPQYAYSTSPEILLSANIKLCGSSRTLKLWKHFAR